LQLSTKPQQSPSKNLNNLKSNTIYVGQTLKVSGTAPSATAQVSAKMFIRPAAGAIISSPFDQRSGEFHYGVELAKNGNVKVVAAADGVLSRSYTSSSYGEVVFIVHNINGQAWETVYAHMRSGSRAVQIGDKVKQGQFLGWMGQQGNQLVNTYISNFIKVDGITKRLTR
jgi:murein DD-endopeptidase MepM/ murein hydrolase activator NlpD